MSKNRSFFLCLLCSRMMMIWAKIITLVLGHYFPPKIYRLQGPSPDLISDFELDHIEMNTSVELSHGNQWD